MLTVEDFSERLFRKMLAVRGPASVGDTGTTEMGLMMLGFFQLTDLAQLLMQQQVLLIIQKSHTGGVIATVFQPA